MYCSILRQCTELESIEVTRRPNSWYPPGDRSFPLFQEFSANEVFEKFYSVRHFHTNYGLSEKVFDSLLASMPNLMFLRLRESMISDKLGTLSSMFRSTHVFTKLDLHLSLPDETLLKLLRKYSSSLLELKVWPETESQSPALSSMSVLGDCTQLHHLHLYNARYLEDNHLETLIKNASDLLSLDLEFAERLTNRSLTQLHGLGRLQHIGLKGIRSVSRDVLRALRKVSNLQYLFLHGRYQTFKGICELAWLTGLRTLDVVVRVDSNSFDMICDNLKNLEVLRLGDCYLLTDADGTKLRKLKHLKTFKFRRGTRFTDLTFEEGLRSAAMESLDLHQCLLSDKGLINIGVHHDRLTRISLAVCEKITETGFSNFLRLKLPLQILQVDDCGWFSDESLKELETNCPRLRELYVQHDVLSKWAINQFRERRPGVSVFYSHFWVTPWQSI